MDETKSIQEQLDEIINAEFDRKCQKVCVPDYYKNQYLKYAMEHNKTLQCIGRTMVEMLLTGFLFTGNPWDKNNANQILNFLNIYSSDDTIDSITQYMFELKRRIRHEFAYLEMDVESRFKSLRSIIAKIYSKAIMGEILEYLYESVELVNNVDTDYDEIHKILMNKIKTNRQKNPSKDSIGYRYIIYSYNQSSSEENLIQACYKLAETIQAFWSDNGYDVVEFKDYISNPKKSTGYQSLHLTVDLGECMIEFQIRTEWMHEQAERGDWAHESVYKDTLIQKFLKNFMYEISESKDCVEKNEKFGLLNSIQIPNLSVSQTPHSEVPRNLMLVHRFEDMRFLEKVHSNN